MDYWGQYLTARARTSAPGTRLFEAVEQARSQHPATGSNVHPISEPAVVDIAPRPAVDPDAPTPDNDFGLGKRWGARWDQAAQGWVDGVGKWRPIVTTTSGFNEWGIGDVDVNGQEGREERRKNGGKNEVGHLFGRRLGSTQRADCIHAHCRRRPSSKSLSSATLRCDLASQR